jgi:hypothetical protein
MTRLARLAAAAAGLLLLLPAAPASADPWVSDPCATGAITDWHADVLTPGVLGEVLIEGWIQPCAGTSSSGFAVGRYDSNHTASYHRVAPYESPDAPTAYIADAYVSLGGGGGGGGGGVVTAMCLLSTPDTRLACVSLDQAVAGELPVVTPISTQDSRVRVTAEPEPDDRPSPTCGSCV